MDEEKTEELSSNDCYFTKGETIAAGSPTATSAVVGLTVCSRRIRDASSSSDVINGGKDANNSV